MAWSRTELIKTPSRLVSSLVTVCLAAGWAQADPAIILQPRNLAVLPGSSAAFRVTAAGTEPLTYQWQRDGGILKGATNATLTLTNVTVADLGGYTVRVRDLAGGMELTRRRLVIGSPLRPFTFA